MFMATCKEHARIYRNFGFTTFEDTLIDAEDKLRGQSAVTSAASIDDIEASRGYRKFMRQLPFSDTDFSYRYTMDDHLYCGITFRNKVRKARAEDRYLQRAG